MKTLPIFVLNCTEHKALIKYLIVDNPLFGRNYLYFNPGLKSSSLGLVPITVETNTKLIMARILEALNSYLDSGWSEEDIPNRVIIVSDGELFIEKFNVSVYLTNFTKKYSNKFKFIFWNITGEALDYQQLDNNIFRCSGISGEIIKYIL